MEFPYCTVCHAPISLRATACAVCEAPAPPLKRTVPSGEIRSGEWVRFHRPPPELQQLYGDVVKALLPNIRILGMVGEGGMALVFVGRDSVLKREVAVKVLSPTLGDDPIARKRFTREAEAIAAVSHPNIVNVYQVGEIPGHGLPYFVMQFVDGPTLGMGALRGMMLTEARVRRLMADVAAGLAAAHRRKVYHRDIKPNNIVLDGETGRAMVLDFGISAASSSKRKSLGARLTEEGMYLGTPTYMSPEQGNGEDVNGQSDVYSLGVLAFELLVGRPPFDGAPIAVMASHMRDVPPRVNELRADVSDEMASLIARCMEKSPAERPTAQDIVHLLDPAEKQSVEWPPPGMSRVRASGARLLAAVTSTSVSVALFFGAVALWPQFAILRSAGAETSMMRSLLLGAGLALVFGMGTMFLFYGLLAVQQWRWAASAGYPSWVVGDVFCDARRDAGNLVNGAGEFTLVPGRVRSRLLTIRRARVWLHVIAALIAVVGIGRWVYLWISQGGADPMQETATRWAAPLLLLYVAYFVLGVPEWSVRRGERARAAGRPSGESTPPLRGELVKMWMASAERARKSLSGREER